MSEKCKKYGTWSATGLGLVALMYATSPLTGIPTKKHDTYNIWVSCPGGMKFDATAFRTGDFSAGDDSNHRRASVEGTCYDPILQRYEAPTFGDESTATGILKVSVSRPGTIFKRHDPDMSVQTSGLESRGDQHPTHTQVTLDNVNRLVDAEYVPRP
jgi:hypothetical protein